MRDLVRNFGSKIPAWMWVVLAGAWTAFLTVEVVFLVPHFVFSSAAILLDLNLSEDRMDTLSVYAGTWVAPAVFLGIAASMSFFVVRSAGGRTVHGVFVGVVAAFCMLTLFLTRFYSQDATEDLLEAGMYLILGVLGGYWGFRRGRASRDRRQALLRASRRIAEARDAERVAVAVGQGLQGSGGVAVALWRPAGPSGANGHADSFPEAFELLASWGGEFGPVAGTLLDAVALGPKALAALAHRRHVTLKTEEMTQPWPPPIRGTVLFVPLSTPLSPDVGLLSVTFGGSGRVSPAVERDYLTAGSLAALAIENMRLSEESREIGALRERNRVSIELHDTALQDLQNVVKFSEAALMMLDQEDKPRAKTPIELSLDIARRGAKEVRRVVQAQRPELLEHPLPEALKERAVAWSTETGVEAQTRTVGEPRRLSPPTEEALFGVAHEALNNVAKHAAARNVELRLRYEGTGVSLSISDDGKGFVTEEGHGPEGHDRSSGDGGGFGLRGGGMRRRVEGLGGRLRVESEPGRGTLLEARIPTAAGTAAAQPAAGRPAGEGAARRNLGGADNENGGER